jgi:hypothetical protein
METTNQFQLKKQHLVSLVLNSVSMLDLNRAPQT